MDGSHIPAQPRKLAQITSNSFKNYRRSIIDNCLAHCNKMKKNFAKVSNPHQSKFKSIINLASFVLTKPGFELLKKVAKKTLVKLGLRKEHYEGYNEWIKAK